MNLQQLKYAVEIARVGSISKAAKNLYMGQPNLSKSIKELEAELGQTLFSRTARGVQPTRAGEDFLGYARSILSQVESLSQLYRKDGAPAARQLYFKCIQRLCRAAFRHRHRAGPGLPRDKFHGHPARRGQR